MAIVGIERQTDHDATIAIIIRTFYGSAEECSVEVRRDTDQSPGLHDLTVAPHTQPVEEDERVFEDVPLTVGWNLATARCGDRPESIDTLRIYRAPAPTTLTYP